MGAGDNTFSGTAVRDDSPLAPVFESYLRYYATGSGHTARAKRLDVVHFLTFLQQYRGLAKPEKLTVGDWDQSSVQRFVEERLRRGEAPATVARRLATLKHMGRVLAEKVPGFTNPAREVKTPLLRMGKPKALKAEQLERVRGRAEERMEEKRSFIRTRNRALIEFLVDTGLRADEVRLLKRSQLDEKLEWITGVRTKGRRYRNVYITSAYRPRLEGYLEARKRELQRFYPNLTPAKDGALPVFISSYNAKPGQPESFLMGPKTIWRAVHECSTDAELHPHLLRHSYAVDLLESSNDIRLVAQALGHADVRVTMRYTERTEEEVAKALEQSRGKKRKDRRAASEK